MRDTCGLSVLLSVPLRKLAVNDANVVIVDIFLNSKIKFEALPDAVHSPQSTVHSPNRKQKMVLVHLCRFVDIARWRHQLETLELARNISCSGLSIYHLLVTG